MVSPMRMTRFMGSAGQPGFRRGADAESVHQAEEVVVGEQSAQRAIVGRVVGGVFTGQRGYVVTAHRAAEVGVVVGAQYGRQFGRAFVVKGLEETLARTDNITKMNKMN